MANIYAIKKKSVGIIRTLVQKLEDMKLKTYYFECAMIYFNAILRGSILYASETYYNLTEKNLRSIERIEESFLRKILNTSKGCPISQLYLETGQWPARFQIIKSRILFLPISATTSTITQLKAEISITLQFSNQPPNRKSSDNCDISAVTDPILMKI